MDLNNKTILVTGGASGMGAATAEYLAQQGASLILLDLNQEAVSVKAKELNGLGIACDVSDAQAVEKAFEQAVQACGDINIVINCAGIAPAARIVGREGAMSLDSFSKVINVNLIGTFNVMRVAAAQMMRQEPINGDKERGVIINTASVAAFEGQIGQAAYSASKGGVAAMTLPAAREFGKFGIRVMTIAPGIMNTPMMAAMPQNVQDSLAEEITFPKRLGNANEYALLAKHIIENPYLNGEVIRLDGGIRMAAK